MLVHGLGSDASCLRSLEQKLRALGHPTLCIDYSGREADLPWCGRELERRAIELLDGTSRTHVNVVAHSLGGLVVRWAATHTRLLDSLRIAVTLGTPHRGTPAAYLAPRSLPTIGEAVRLLRPGLPDLPGLVEGADGRTRWVAVAGQYDWVVPPAYARLPESANVTNIVLPRTGHLQLTRSALCHRVVAYQLDAVRPAELQRLSA